MLKYKRKRSDRNTVTVMEHIILYGSRYGSTRRYAGRLSELTGIPVADYHEALPLKGKTYMIYLGSLYAGGVSGVKKTFRNLALRPGQKLMIVTVGLADPGLSENRENIRRSLQKQLPAGIYGAADLFHLRGAIDYEKLSLSHRTMMSLLYRSLKNRPSGEWSAEDRALMETYGKQVDFVDFDTLQPVVERIREWENERLH